MYYVIIHCNVIHLHKHFNFGYNYLTKLHYYVMHYNVHSEYLYNALYIKALSTVL